MRRKTKKRSKKRCKVRNKRKKRQPPRPRKIKTSTREKTLTKKSEYENKFIQNDGARFKIHRMLGDGNCLFRTMAYFVLGRQDQHNFIRKQVVRYISNNWSLFRDFKSESDVQDYRNHMNSPCTYGGEEEIAAFSEIFGCKIHVFFKDSPQRGALAFGNYTTNCYVLYSGPLDLGHYDVLLPTTKKVCNIQFYKESIRQLRDDTVAKFDEELANFKSSRNNKQVK